MKRKIYISLLFLVFAASMNAQSWPRFFWEQIVQADTVGSIAIAVPGLDGSWSDSLRFWQGKLRIGVDTAATLADVRTLGFNETGTANTLPLWATSSTLADSWLSQGISALSLSTTRLMRFIGHTTAGRPTGLAGHFGFNTDKSKFEFHNGTAWANLGDNISNTDLTFSASRTHAIGSNDLTFSTTGNANTLSIKGGSGQVAIGGSTYAGVLNIIGNVGAENGSGNYITGSGRTGVLTEGSDGNTLTGYANFPLMTSTEGSTGMGYENFNSWDNTTTSLYNTGLGYRNFKALLNGNYNTGIGGGNFQSATSTTGSVGIGLTNFSSLLTGNGNVGIGTENFKNITGGSNNVGIGYYNARLMTGSAIANVALGSNMTTWVSGSANVALGANPSGAASGNFNTMIGNSNLRLFTSGNYNTAIGSQNHYSLVSGDNNAGIGYYNLASLSSGSWNTGIGRRSLYNVTSGSSNIAMGYDVGVGITSSNYIIGLGYKVLNSTTDLSMSNTIAIGYEALATSTGELDNSIAIGYRAGYSSASNSSAHIGINSNALRDAEISLGSSSYNYGRWDLTGQIRMPLGTTAERLTAEKGDFRANSTNSDFEGHDGTEWKRFAWYNSTSLNVGNYDFDIDQTVGSGQDSYTMGYNDTSGEIELRPSALSTHAQLKETVLTSITPGVTYQKFKDLFGQNLSNFTATDSTLTYTGSEDVLVEINYTGGIFFDISGAGTYRVTVKPFVNGGSYTEAISDVQISADGAEDWIQPIAGTAWVTLSTNDVISLRYQGTTGLTASLNNLSLTVKAL